MKRSTKQKLAIWYRIHQNMKERQKSFLWENGYYGDYTASKYKTMTWYIKQNELTEDYQEWCRKKGLSPYM